MSDSDQNGTPVTRREMFAELRAMRWELRAWMLGAIGAGAAFRFDVPQSAVAALLTLF